jgi:NTE family protein
MKTEDDSRLTVGLALGGGGARGMAHIGVLKVLTRENIPIDAIAGTSMGGVIGSAFAAGVPVEDIESVALRVRKRSERIKLVDFELTGSGLLKGTRVYRFLASILGEVMTFGDLHIPLALVAVELNTGREVVLREGKLVEAIRATISVPGVFEPVKRDDLLLVDGGVLNSVPVDVARNMGARFVIAVDVLPHFPQNQSEPPPKVQPPKASLMPKSVQELMYSYMIMISELTEYKIHTYPPDIIIRPSLPADVHLFNGFDRAQEIIEAGEVAAQEALPKIHSCLQLKLRDI